MTEHGVPRVRSWQPTTGNSAPRCYCSLCDSSTHDFSSRRLRRVGVLVPAHQAPPDDARSELRGTRSDGSCPPRAAPIPAPDDIPRMYGSAIGFLNNACKTTPETERAAPARTARITRGSRMSKIIVFSVGVPLPEITPITWLRGIPADPWVIENIIEINNNKIKNIIIIPYFFRFFR